MYIFGLIPYLARGFNSFPEAEVEQNYHNS